MNTNVAAFAASQNVVEGKEVFTASTFGMDLKHKDFSTDAFEQVGNGMRLVILNGRLAIGTAAALDSAESRVYRVNSLTELKAAMSAFSTLIQGIPAQFKIGFHPRAGIDRNAFTFGEVALVKSNYQGMDIAGIPDDNQWHALIEKPVAGKELGDHYVDPKPVAPKYRQIVHEMMDLIIDGYIIDGFIPREGNVKTDGLRNFFAVTLGSNEASLAGDEKLQAIYKQRYNEAVTARNLDRKAAKALSGVEKEDRKKVALDQELTLMTVDGQELDLLALAPGSLVAFQDRRGRSQGQRTWRPDSAYSIQSFAEAAKMGMLVEVAFDAAQNV